jgi:hypothetical protein
MPKLPWIATLGASLACLLAPVALAGDDAPAEKPAEAKVAQAELDQKSPPIVMKDTQGRSFELLDSAIGAKDAEAVVMAAARKFGAPEGAKLETPIADLSGVKDEDGEVDEAKLKELAVAAGEFFGLTATDESAASFKTLGDLLTWVKDASSAPILLFTWSPRCPAVVRLNDKIVETIANNKVRAYAVACNFKDTEVEYAKYLETFDFHLRIFPDREQKITDVLGGKTTPHFFLFDSKGVLRYRGGLDNDAMGYMDESERKNHLVDAIAAVRAGKDVEVKDTAPTG